MMALADRTLGGFPISIPTSMMLEAVFKDGDKDKRNVEQYIDINDFDIHYINVFTLVRNIESSIASKSAKEDLYNNKYIIETLVEEINFITILYNDTKCKPVLFVPDYSKIYMIFRNSKIPDGHDVTNASILRILTITSMLSNIKPEIDMDIVSNTHKLPSNNKKVLITSHLAVDLLNVKNIPNLLLLESHTGKLKNKNSWFSKYNKIGKLPMDVFPFYGILLFLLGDSNISKPINIKLRKELHELVLEHKWNPSTGLLKVTHTLNSRNEFKEVLKNYKELY